jgi:hypothetical protein
LTARKHLAGSPPIGRIRSQVRDAATDVARRFGDGEVRLSRDGVALTP